MASVEQELWNIFTFYTLHGNPLDPEHMRVSANAANDSAERIQVPTGSPTRGKRARPRPLPAHEQGIVPAPPRRAPLASKTSFHPQRCGPSVFRERRPRLFAGTLTAAIVVRSRSSLSSFAASARSWGAA